MKILHSLWTGALGWTPIRSHCLIHALSAALASKWYPFTELVTDRRGLLLVEMLGIEYSAYVTTLDAIPEGLSHVWAVGKMFALVIQDEPAIQIDTDVLLLDPLPRRVRESRLCAQSIDTPYHYDGGDMLRAHLLAGLKHEAVAFNCGLIGGCDIFLLRRYASEAIGLAHRFIGEAIDGTCASMVMEQAHLGDFARRHRCRVETALPLNHSKADEERVGLVHLWGGWKRDADKVAKCEAIFADEFPREYAHFLRGWARIEKEGLPS